MKERKKEFDPQWNECSTLEAWVEDMLKQGYTTIVKHMMNSLPESSREKYREIWKRVMEEKRDDRKS